MWNRDNLRILAGLVFSRMLATRWKLDAVIIPLWYLNYRMLSDCDCVRPRRILDSEKTTNRRTSAMVEMCGLFARTEVNFFILHTSLGVGDGEVCFRYWFWSVGVEGLHSCVKLWPWIKGIGCKSHSTKVRNGPIGTLGNSDLVCVRFLCQNNFWIGIMTLPGFDLH